MSDFREPVSDDDREVLLDDEEALDSPPPTLDPLESIEHVGDELTEREREAAIESGEIEP